MDRTLSRRQAITGAATAGVGVPLLAACGEDDPSPVASDPSSTTPTPSEPAPTSSGSAKGNPPPAGGISTADVPVGGGLVVAEEEVVITQPTEGEFKAFTAACTHQGCLVARVSDEIECDCHGSRFSITDGEPVAGPAPSALAPADFTVSGDQITL